MVFCSDCGTDVSGLSFCSNCGKTTSGQSSSNTGIPSASTENSAVPEFNTNLIKPKDSKSRVYLIGGGVGIAALLAAFLIFSGGPTALQTAYENCSGPSTFGLSIDEDGKGMFLDMQGEEDVLGADYSDISCILSELDVPDSVLSQMSNTTALMGTQTATWDNISANWTYHPDRGLDIALSID